MVLYKILNSNNYLYTFHFVHEYIKKIYIKQLFYLILYVYIHKIIHRNKIKIYIIQNK